MNGILRYDIRIFALFAGICTICISFYFPAISLIISSLSANEKFGAILYSTLTDSLFWSAFKTTFILSILTAIIVIGLAIPFTYFLLSQKPRRERFLVFIVFTSLLTSLLLRTFSWFVILGNQGPLKNLSSILLPNSDLGVLFTKTSVLIGMTHVLLPIGILCLWTIMKPNDKNYRVISGQFSISQKFYFFKNFLPRAKRPAFMTMALIFILAFGFHLTPSLLGGGAGDTMTIGVLIDEQVNRFGNWEKGAAYSLALMGVLFIPIAVISALKTLNWSR